MRAALAIAAALCAAPALAHVTVAPAEATANAFQRYTITAPSEKPLPTVKVEMQFPEGLRVRATEVLPGWRTTTRRNPNGDITSVVWDNGSIPASQFGMFGVIARNPDAAVDLSWKAIQTYQDGSEVQWVGARGTQFPAAITRVRPASAAASGSLSTEAVVSWAALAVAVVALVFGVLAWMRSAKR